MADEKKLKHLSTHNTKGFFAGMKTGDKFTFNWRHYEDRDVIRKAVDAGLKVQLGPTSQSEENKRHGRVVGIVDEIPFSVKEDAPKAEEPKKEEPKNEYAGLDAAAEKAVRLRFGLSSIEERATFLARAVASGTLTESVSYDGSGMRDYEFANDYGDMFDEVHALALELESYDPAKASRAVVEAAVRAGAWPGLAHNHRMLEAAGMLRHAEDFCDGEHGLVEEIMKLNLENGALEIVQTASAGKKMYFVAGEPDEYYACLDDAILAGMFPEACVAAARLLYRGYVESADGGKMED